MDVTDGELIEYISESSMMSKALVDYEGMHALHSLLTAVQMSTRLCLTFASLYLRLASSSAHHIQLSTHAGPAKVTSVDPSIR